MFGKPKDVEGECNAHLMLGDDHGDGEATIRCGLPEDHEGHHTETFMRHERPVTITWVHDEREMTVRIKYWNSALLKDGTPPYKHEEVAEAIAVDVFELAKKWDVMLTTDALKGNVAWLYLAPKGSGFQPGSRGS
jgi:hypothetical protein